MIAEAILGYQLPKGVEIHHVDGNGHNNSHDNLVICPNRQYHALLHQRQRALDTCGHAGWLKCDICRKYDDPINMAWINPKRPRQAYHRECSKNAARKFAMKKSAELEELRQDLKGRLEKL